MPGIRDLRGIGYLNKQLVDRPLIQIFFFICALNNMCTAET
jgi:hypothetical protein